MPFFVGIQRAAFDRDTLPGDRVARWNLCRQRRGVSPWYDLVDRVGACPFEVARPEEIDHFHEQRGFLLMKQQPVDNHTGRSESVFQK